MRIIRIAGPALIATLALLGLVGSSTASAHEFIASGTGEVVGKGGRQVFEAEAGRRIVCETVAAVGSVTSLRSEELELKLQLGSCSITFSGGTLPVEVSAALLLLMAGGTLGLLSTITFNVPLAGCEITLSPQSGLSAVAYANNAGRLKIATKIEKIAWSGTGGICGEKGTNGTNSGEMEAELVGGSLGWE